MKQLVAHLFGDYILQTDHEANTKTEAWLPAATHAAKYTACFLPLTRSPKALAVIGGTHMVLDHYRTAKRVVWAKNQLAPVDKQYSWEEAQRNNGYPKTTPPGIAFGLMVVADNTIHMLINEWALNRWERND